MSRVDRHWLLAMTLAAVPLFVYAFATTIQHDQNLSSALDPAYLVTLVFASIVGAALASLFLVGIPLRIAQNMIVKERRSHYQWETVALIVTFAALCGMLYSMWRFPAEG